MCSRAPPPDRANTYSGATNVNAGTLRAGAPNTFSPNSAVTVASGGTLDLNGFSQTVSRVTNAGLVNMGTGTAPGTVLTTTSYTGTGGTIAMNTFLGADGSPSDKLVINGGTATGTTGLLIHNAGGPGLETTANGILVVNAISGARRHPVPLRLTTRSCAPAPSTIVCFGVASTAATPTTGSCARASSSGRGRAADWPDSAANALPPGPIRSSGRSLPPMAWCSRSRGRWACRRSAPCTNASATR